MADKRKSLSRLRLFPSFSVKYKGGEEKKGRGVFSRDTGVKQSSTPVLLAVRRKGEQEARQCSLREQEARQGGRREQEGRQGSWREHKRQGSWREQEMEMEHQQKIELEQTFRSLPNQQKLRRRR